MDSFLNNKKCFVCTSENCNMKKHNFSDDILIFILKARILYPDYIYSYHKFDGTELDITITCNLHGDFKMEKEDHLLGLYCPSCRAVKIIEKAKVIHENKYTYKYTYMYVDSTLSPKFELQIKCKLHGTFWQYAKHHLNGRGCGKCLTNEKRRSKFIRKANIYHDLIYDYSHVKYIDSETPVKIQCWRHGFFSMSPKLHLRSHLKTSKCPRCIYCPSCQLFKTMGELCDYCKPREESKTYSKTKELLVVKYLKNNLPEYDFIHNKSVGTDCTGGHLFPDIRYDCITYQLIIEIDENKHRGASYSCDEQRMYDIIAKLGMPCIFIRYNPDSKNSDKEELLKTVKKYLEKGKDTYNCYGFKCDYMFY